MRGKFSIWGLGLLAWGLLVAAEVQAEPRPNGPRDDGRQRTDRFIVVPREGVDPEAFARWSEAHGLGSRARRPWERGIQVVRPREGGNLQDAIRECELSGLVDFVEPDYLIRASLAPDDPRYADGSAWHLDNTGLAGGTVGADIDAAGAWDLVTDASSVIVAVVDSGIRTTHEDLAGNLWRNPAEIPGNGVDDDGNGIVDDVFGFDATNGSGDPTDKSGHGSHVAGIIGAVGNNGRGVTGIAWKVRLMALRFIDETLGGSTSDAITCIDYAVAHGARVINASWGSAARSRSLQRAIVRARNAGVVVVAAAGNDGTNIDVTPTYPGAFPDDNLVCVTATSRGDGMYPEGNYGSVGVDLGAPGMSVISTWAGSDSDYLLATGTSMATPMVTGALALLAARHPESGYAAWIAALLESVDPLPALAGKTVTGGRLNIARALHALDRAMAVAPRVTLVRPEVGALRVVVSGSPGIGYTLEASADLLGWTSAGTGTADGTGTVEFPVAVDGEGARLFRVRQTE